MLIVMHYQRRRFKERVDYVTSSGYGDGGDWRRRVGLRGGGPTAIITTLGTLSFDAETKEAFLSSYHPGVTQEEVIRETGWPLRISQSVHETAPPTQEELAIIRYFDPQGFWTRR
jgi:glutaconate CoA-transferase subunit B